MNLRSLFAGTKEAAELPPKRGPGRLKNVRTREEEVERPDAVLAALESMPDHHEAFDERLRVRYRKRKADCMGGGEVPGSCAQALVEASEKQLSQLQMPGNILRSNIHEGPQVKLRLCNWFEKKLVELGGSDEMFEVLLGAIAEKWSCARFQIVKIYEDEGQVAGTMCGARSLSQRLEEG